MVKLAAWKSRQGAFSKQGLSKDAFLILLPCLFAALVLFLPRENIFTVKAKTDVASIKLVKSHLNQWDVSDAILITDPLEGTRKKLDSLDAFLLLNEATEARFTRERGYITLVLSNPISLGSIDTPSQQFDLATYAELIIPLEGDRIFPFEGSLVLGEDVAVGVGHILHEASLTIVEQQLFKQARYKAEEYTLESGNKLELFSDDSHEAPAVGMGFLTLSEQEGLKVVSHGRAEVARVERLGSAGYDISSSIWSRLLNDPLVAALTTLLATLFLSMEFIVLSRSLVTNRAKNDSN